MNSHAHVAATTHAEPLVLRESIAPGVVRLTLNRPKSFNSLSEEMLDALQTALSSVAMDESERVVVLAAAGKAFCAGHDLREMRANPSEEYYRKLFAQCSAMMLTIQNMPQPVIARVQGIATAAGCQLVSMCDLAVAADDARFAVSGINYGLFCSTPSVGLSRNVLRKQAMEMLLTGDFIDASTAVARGLINHAVPAAELDATIAALCTKITDKPQVAVTLGKQMFYKQLEQGIAAAYDLAGATMACNMMDEAALEGFQAFIEKRAPSWKPHHK
jgi:enoyl-CoA hydratase/carnithine racemase